MARENALFYRVSANGPAGDWYWEVISDRNIIARGVAPTRVRARADALKAAASHVGRQAEDLSQPRGDAFPSLRFEEAQEAVLVELAVQSHRPNRLLAAMPPNTLALLEPDLRQVSLEQGEVLLEPGELIENIYFPLTGLISLMVIGTDGNFIETSTVGREGAVGLHSGLGRRRSFTRATAQIGGKFSTVRAARFEHVANGNAPIRDVILQYTEVLWAETQQIAACNAMHGASARLCRWLLQIADRIGSEEVPLTQEFLAQMLGARRTTVTLLAQRMQAKGLIRYRRGRIVILDRKGLEACACECYHVMHDEKLPRALGVDL